ncbi:endonuclease/exonuclease/phosphatase family protein [Streptomyces sp. NPDC051218]|uniref:endonuclease/exonuclease/phosphatase family protein n=1 Tax=Streptomyces sp. NPDC051218 TaxID=3365645 RepID=UPI0037AE9D04
MDDGTGPDTRLAGLLRWPSGGFRLRWGVDAKGRSRWTRGRILAALAVLTTALLAFHSAVPNTVGRFGSLLETFLPWLGLAVPLLLTLALLRRSALALLALLLPVAAWGLLFGGRVTAGDGGAHDLTAVQHNVSDVNADPAGTARALSDAGPDLIALEELTPAALPAYEASLRAQYPYRAVRGTVGLWSKHPLTEAGAVDIRPEGIGKDWNRGLRARARTPWGDVAVYVAHLPSVRVQWHGFSSGRRDESAGLLGAALDAEQLEKVILLGDLNATVDDRGLDPVTSRLDSAGEDNFAFSWPTTLPISRIDHIMTRAARVTQIRPLPSTGSDHLPVAADIRFAP